jgi:asparagine synthase (glutamine-hydrolysing)
MFGGYDIFKEAKIRAFCAARPDSQRRRQLLKRLYPYLRSVQSQPDAFLEGFFRTGSGPADRYFSHVPRWRTATQMKRLFSQDVKAQLRGYDVYDDLGSTLPGDFDRWNLFSRAQYLETAVLLPGYILSSQGDRVAMAHAVEGRFPFLDHRVVQFASSLPVGLKMRVLNEKYILKLAATDLIPARVRRRRKQPYRAPEAASFVAPGRERLPEYAEALLSPDRIRADGIFDANAVDLLVDKVRAGRATGQRDNMAFLGVLSTQLVVDRFLRAHRPVA